MRRYLGQPTDAPAKLKPAVAYRGGVLWWKLAACAEGETFHAYTVCLVSRS